MIVLPTIHLESLIFYYTTSSILLCVSVCGTEKPGELRHSETSQLIPAPKSVAALPLLFMAELSCAMELMKACMGDRMKWIGKKVIKYMLILNMKGLLFTFATLVLILLKWKIPSHYCQDAAFHAKLILMITLVVDLRRLFHCVCEVNPLLLVYRNSYTMCWKPADKWFSVHHCISYYGNCCDHLDVIDLGHFG